MYPYNPAIVYPNEDPTYSFLASELANASQENFRLHEFLNSKISKTIEAAHLHELCKYDLNSFVIEAVYKYPLFVKSNSVGNIKQVPLTFCSNFYMEKICWADTDKISFCIRFILPNGNMSHFSTDISDFCPKKVFLDFSRAGGVLASGIVQGKGKDLFFSFISTLIGSAQIIVRSHRLWFNFPETGWGYDKYYPCLNLSLFDFCGWSNGAPFIMGLLRLYTLLRLRLKGLKIEIEKPVLLMDGAADNENLISLNQSAKKFRALIEGNFRPYISVRMPNEEGISSYRSKVATENLVFLCEQTSSLPAFPIIFSEDFCEPGEGLPFVCGKIDNKGILPLEISASTTIKSLLAYTEENSKSFEKFMKETYSRYMEQYFENPYCSILSCLSVVSDFLAEFFLLSGESSAGRIIKQLAAEVLPKLSLQWDEADSQDILERFVDSLYTAVKRHEIGLYDLSYIPCDSNLNASILYDESSLYISRPSLEFFLANSLPACSIPELLRLLEVSGHICKRENGVGKRTYFFKKNIYFDDGSTIRPRLLCLPLSLFYRPGRISLVNLR